MSQLSEEQKAKVAEWIQSGADLNKIQDQLREEFDVTLSFMDTRFLISDLGLEIKEEEPPAEEESAPEAAGEAVEDETPELVTDDEPSPEGGGGKVTVTMDQIGIPGMVASGKVTFSDGKAAQWYFDQMGQLGINPDEEGYRPSEEDLMDFQVELQRVAQESGI